MIPVELFFSLMLVALQQRREYDELLTASKELQELIDKVLLQNAAVQRQNLLLLDQNKRLAVMAKGQGNG